MAQAFCDVSKVSNQRSRIMKVNDNPESEQNHILKNRNEFSVFSKSTYSPVTLWIPSIHKSQNPDFHWKSLLTNITFHRTAQMVPIQPVTCIRSHLLFMFFTPLFLLRTSCQPNTSTLLLQRVSVTSAFLPTNVPTLVVASPSFACDFNINDSASFPISKKFPKSCHGFSIIYPKALFLPLALFASSASGTST